MKFKNLIDVIQVFANEYCLPGNNILILGSSDPKIKEIFNFIDSKVIFNNFEDQSFDLILNFTLETNIFKWIKNDGRILMKDEILNGLEYYYIDNQSFTVL